MVQSNCIYIEIILIIIIQIMTNIFSNTHLVPSSVLIYIIIANIRCVLLGPGPWFNHLSCIISWKPHKNPANGCYYPHFTGEEREVHHRANGLTVSWKLNLQLPNSFRSTGHSLSLLLPVSPVTSPGPQLPYFSCSRPRPFALGVRPLGDANISEPVERTGVASGSAPTILDPFPICSGARAVPSGSCSL